MNVTALSLLQDFEEYDGTELLVDGVWREIEIITNSKLMDGVWLVDGTIYIQCVDGYAHYYQPTDELTVRFTQQDTAEWLEDVLPDEDWDEDTGEYFDDEGNELEDDTQKIEIRKDEDVPTPPIQWNDIPF